MSGFKLIVLGCGGGPREDNLSGYLLASQDSSDFIVLDMGSLLHGMEVALEKNCFADLPLDTTHLLSSGVILKRHIKAYLLSHAHLDHCAALVSNSQTDSGKPILGIASTIDNLRDHLFNGKIWPNWSNEGIEPLGRYHYIRLPLHEKVPIPSTDLTVEAYLLCHPGNYPSTAFLIENPSKDALLYFGDTSSDVAEEKKQMEIVWRKVAPLVQANRLRGILLECSYPTSLTKKTRYGHLDPHLMMWELHHLKDLAKTSLKGLKVVVTHRKESLEKGVDLPQQIAEELLSKNDLEIDFIFPSQGDKILF